ncbi:hypothetical protein [Nostoc sp.]|uniref:hypothetical protein n=1 Tax=Nostoc sp. TaxID=1180 RepID=UPI002FFB4F20
MTKANAITNKPQKLTNMRRRIRAASRREAACRQTSLKMGKFIQQIMFLTKRLLSRCYSNFHVFEPHLS